MKSHCLASGYLLPEVTSAGKEVTMGFSVTSLCPKSSKHGQEMLSFFVFFDLFALCELRGPSLHQVCLCSSAALCAQRKCLSDLREDSRADEGWSNGLLKV